MHARAERGQGRAAAVGRGEVARSGPVGRVSRGRFGTGWRLDRLGRDPASLGREWGWREGKARGEGVGSAWARGGVGGWAAFYFLFSFPISPHFSMTNKIEIKHNKFQIKGRKIIHVLDAMT